MKLHPVDKSEDLAKTSPAENCTCGHGGEDHEDHTPGNGCERGGCLCRFWVESDEDVVTFEMMSLRTEVMLYYVVNGAPDVTSESGKTILRPISARFVFVDGEIHKGIVSARLVKKDGSLSDRITQVPSIYAWNQKTWPEWLVKLCKVAYVDFRAGVR